MLWCTQSIGVSSAGCITSVRGLDSFGILRRGILVASGRCCLNSVTRHNPDVQKITIDWYKRVQENTVCTLQPCFLAHLDCAW